jgi:pimeloyl-ACP methyl ester carboxylesterase
MELQMTRLILALAILLVAGCNTALQPRVTTFNGHLTEIATAGDRGTTVVFESGLGDDWRPWDGVAADVALHARVFTYSRPGYGHSDAPTSQRDGTHIVEELRGLLAAEGYAPPYILVGHSFGGAYMELFARAHPGEVSGLVTVDGRPANFLTACEAAKLPMCGLPDDTLATLPPVQVDEYEAFAALSEEIRAAGPLGPYPVRVLTASQSTSARQALWESMQAALAAEAVDGRQTIFRGAGHYLQLERSREVADIIEELVATPAR